MGALRSLALAAAKRAAIRAGLEAIALTRAGRWLPRAAGLGAIFTLHHVRPYAPARFNPNRHLSVTPEFLDETLSALIAAGYEPVHLEDLPREARPGRRVFCMTLDDGYRDNARYAAPVFRRHGVPYTIFITPGFVQRRRSLWWETAEAMLAGADSYAFDYGTGERSWPCYSLREKHEAFARLARFVSMADENVAVARIQSAARYEGVDAIELVDREIMNEAELRELVQDPLARLGAHTMTHPNLKRLPLARLREEISRSAAEVSAYAGRPVTTLAYPYGFAAACGPREATIAAELGITLAVTTQPGTLTPAALEHPTLLPRISLNGYFQRPHLALALATGLPFRG